MAEMKWSEQQERIIEECRSGTGHFTVVARAGTGKTTTLLHGAKVAPEDSILVCAFSRVIADELNARIAGAHNVQAATLHSIGLRCVKRFWSRVRVDFSSERADALAQQVCPRNTPDPILRLVSKLHTKGREIVPHAANVGDLTDLALRFECEPDESYFADNFDLEFVENYALRAMVKAAEVQPTETGIDGADMIFLPLRNRWLTKQHDMVFVDEAQDMTNAQLEIATGVCRGRIAVIGDDRQAIFAFRGADSGSLARLTEELKAKVLPMTVTYRCGQSIVREAQRYVPDFEAGPENPEGEVRSLPLSRLVQAAVEGDFILSRVNAPLVSVAMQLLKANKRARIKGRDIGKGLTKLVNQLRARTIPELLQKLEAWRERQVNRLQAKFKARPAALQSRIEGITDQSDMITAFAMDALNVSAVVSQIETLFVDDGRGSEGVINCSSVHRAKGLEAHTVYVLQDTLRRDSQEEENICYVAVTRAKSRLVYVSEGATEASLCPNCGNYVVTGTTCGCDVGSKADSLGSGTRKPRKTRRK